MRRDIGAMETTVEIPAMCCTCGKDQSEVESALLYLFTRVVRQCRECWRKGVKIPDEKPAASSKAG